MNDLSGSSFCPTETNRVDNVELRSLRARASQACNALLNLQIEIDDPATLYEQEAYRNKKRCAAFPFETGIRFRRKTDFFPEEDTTKCEDPLGSHFENENDFESKKNQ
ncbi:hypothetical protein TNCV_3358621 [Trichonephila clavipes]|nr:hypothetical protein TNCV_3358621 [Trichonephila clavipes]